MTDLPQQIELARKRAFHALGERLYTVEYRPLHGPKRWWIHVRFGDEIVPFSAPVVAVAIAKAASRLHATGWTPTHERLEWERYSFGVLYLRMHAGPIRMDIASITPLGSGVAVLSHVLPRPPWDRYRFHKEAEAVGCIAEWVSDNLPYYLPPFPSGASDA